MQDEWTRECIPIPPGIIGGISRFACVCIVLNGFLFAIYGISLFYTGRPFFRVLSFGCIVAGLLLCVPQYWRRMDDSTYLLSTNLPLHILWGLGDLLSHAGMMMLVYWDICPEAVWLVHALEPKRQKFGLKIVKIVGAISVVGQLALIPFWSLVYLLESKSSRAVLSASFFVVQCYGFYGLIPAIGFAVLARGLHRLRGKLPNDVPKSVLHRIKFTQIGIGLFLLLGIADALLALFPACQPFIRQFSGTFYTYVVYPSLATLTPVLLGLETWLSLQDMSSTLVAPVCLESEELASIVRQGVSALAMLCFAFDSRCLVSFAYL